MTKNIWTSRLSVAAQLILGFFLGVALITGAIGGVGYLYFKSMSVRPKKPIFYEETAEGQKEIQQQNAAAAKSNSKEEAVASEPEPEPEPEPELPPNAYKAKVTWSEGLSLRAEPSLDAERIGGIGYDAEIIVLEVSADSNWQRVLLPWNEQEGWVKNGNTERVAN
ncbi:SH3 domain-containing protein [Myxosarcina sp. GI1]|uniref:SH3 domain-containing protein n=1 Tax=Myxosarcina sp. GI1 TaxID=1541065 RepID=UPI0005615681|nr:SH3 domain-containing protein [Myxosarcina sp. GI1]